jgi:hypothetical protein
VAVICAEKTIFRLVDCVSVPTGRTNAPAQANPTPRLLPRSPINRARCDRLHSRARRQVNERRPKSARSGGRQASFSKRCLHQRKEAHQRFLVGVAIARAFTSVRALTLLRISTVAI